MILIIEDDAAISDVMSLMIAYEFGTEAPYQVTRLREGQAALTYLENPQNEPPTLLFLDLFLGGLDGIPFLHELDRRYGKAQWPCPVVVVSAREDALCERELDRLPITERLLKPFDMDHYLALVKRYAIQRKDPVLCS